MKSLFFRNFFFYAVLICVSFTALGSTFTYQINDFALQEKMNMLSTTMTRATESTVSYLEETSSAIMIPSAARVYRTSMTQLAADCDGTIFITDSDGEMLLVATKDGCYSQQGGFVPQKAVNDVLTKGSYYELSNMGGYLSSTHFVSGTTAKFGSKSEISCLPLC